MKIFLIHGAYGNPDENWFSWIKTELESKGHEVIAPTFPTPQFQSLDNWLEIINPYIHLIDEETIFVAHSVGSAFVLNVLEMLSVQVKACFFVAGFIEPLGNPVFDMLNQTFVDKLFNLGKIKSNCKNFVVYASDNDPYVPLIKTAKMVKLIGARLIIIPNAGHFNQSAGYTKFTKLLADINQLT